MSARRTISIPFLLLLAATGVAAQPTQVSSDDLLPSSVDLIVDSSPAVVVSLPGVKSRLSLYDVESIRAVPWGNGSPERWFKLLADAQVPPSAAESSKPKGDDTTVTIAGAATWCYKSCDRGLAYPLATWPSVFGLGRGEFLALFGGDGAGVALAHKFFYMQPGGVHSSLSIGVAAIIPYSVTASSSDKKVNVWSSVRPALVVILTFDTSGSK